MIKPMVIIENQDGGEILHIRLGFETASWQHAHILNKDLTRFMQRVSRERQNRASKRKALLAGCRIATPEAKKVAVCCDRLGDGTGTPLEAACSSTLTEFPGKLLELEPGPFSAANEAFTASTITAIRVGS